MPVHKPGFHLLRSIILIVGFKYAVSQDRNVTSHHVSSSSRSLDGMSLAAIARRDHSDLTGVYTGSDAGRTWTHVLEGNNCEQVVTSLNGQVLLSSCSRGLLRSLDYGQTWRIVSSIRADAMFITPERRVCLIMSDGDMLLSKDTGTSWTSISRFPPNTSYELAASNDGRVIALASAKDGLFVSTDMGESWRLKLQGPEFTGKILFLSVSTKHLTFHRCRRRCLVRWRVNLRLQEECQGAFAVLK